MSIGNYPDDRGRYGPFGGRFVPETLMPALESAHALAGARRFASENPGSQILVGLSGRGDKDLATLQAMLLAEPD